MDEHKSQLRPGSASDQTIYVHGMSSYASELDPMMVSGSPNEPLEPFPIPQQSTILNDDVDGNDSDLNEVDDAPRASFVHLESDDEMDIPIPIPPSSPLSPLAHQSISKHSARHAAAQAAIAANAADESLAAGGESDDVDENDDTLYCYCQSKWTGEMMVSCDQCLQWFHAGQSAFCATWIPLYYSVLCSSAYHTLNHLANVLLSFICSWFDFRFFLPSCRLYGYSRH
jgi:hypothetical protein